MKQTARIISTYASDVSGVCSALYELGGLTVMHDASGCNSTYNTHDEPRWYDMDSMVYISGLSEMEAIMGDDDKLINDIVQAAVDLSPKFIAIAGSPVPMMIGTDFKAIASIIEKKTGIPTFGFATNGMHTYISGASMAFAAVAERMVKQVAHKTEHLSVNIIGATPLDYSINSTLDSIKNYLIQSDIEINSVYAIGSNLDDIKNSAAAHVNLVISYSGLAAAKVLKQRFNIPYVVGIPVIVNSDTRFADKVVNDVISAAKTGRDCISYVDSEFSSNKTFTSDMTTDNTLANNDNSKHLTIIGESVIAGSIAAAISYTTKYTVNVLCPVETEDSLLNINSYRTLDEDELIPYLDKTSIVMADPLYKPICDSKIKFISLPHEGFSGRIFRDEIPDLCKYSLSLPLEL